MSSLGSAPASPTSPGGKGGGSRSIDVEFNLLRTWSDARDDLNRRRLKALSLLGGALVLGAALLPGLTISAASSRRLAAGERAALAQKTATTIALESRAASAAAPLARRAALETSSARTDAFLRIMASVVESSPPDLRVVRSSLQVAAGVATVKLHAEAPDAATARRFLVALSRATRITEVRQTAINGNGRGGVEFDASITGNVQTGGRG